MLLVKIVIFYFLLLLFSHLNSHTVCYSSTTQILNDWVIENKHIFGFRKRKYISIEC